jgi:hypothetical protein
LNLTAATEHVIPIRPGVQSHGRPLDAATKICIELAAKFRQPEEVVDDWDFWEPIDSQLDAVLALLRHHDAQAGDRSRVVPRLAFALVEVVGHCALNPAEWAGHAQSFAVLLDAASEILARAEEARS